MSVVTRREIDIVVRDIIILHFRGMHISDLWGDQKLEREYTSWRKEAKQCLKWQAAAVPSSSQP
jgi:hypothetical protein